MEQQFHTTPYGASVVHTGVLGGKESSGILSQNSQNCLSLISYVNEAPIPQYSWRNLSTLWHGCMVASKSQTALVQMLALHSLT